MSDDKDPGELIDRMGHEAEDLERRRDEHGDLTGALEQDWQRKRDDSGVPGAPPPDHPEGADEPPSDSDR